MRFEVGGGVIDPIFLFALLCGVAVGVLVVLLPAKTTYAAMWRGMIAFSFTVALVSVVWRLSQ